MFRIQKVRHILNYAIANYRPYKTLEIKNITQNYNNIALTVPVHTQSTTSN